jgi:murein DD-endopeptidase MepM/ murein hydrolase activator NlpD
VDLLARCGAPVTAASAGRVKTNDDQSAAGNYLVLTDTPSGEDQVYMHLREPSPLRPGELVAPGQPIGEVGDTGNATACLLHFELWSSPGWYAGGKPRDPRPDLSAWSGATTAR